MKTVIAGFALSLVMVMPALALTVPVAGGTVDCEAQTFTDSTLLTTSPATQNQLVGCHGGNGNPELVVSEWGFTNSQLPHIAPGVSVHDAAGMISYCPSAAVMGFSYCVDITGTDYYKNRARNEAHRLQNAGITLGLFAYWLTN